MIRLEAEFKAVRLFYVQQVTDVLRSCYRRHVAVKKPAAENGEWVRGRTKGSARCRLDLAQTSVALEPSRSRHLGTVNREGSMARRNLKFKERDVSRAIRGVVNAGISVGRVMVDRDGNIVVIASQPGDVIEAKPSDDPSKPWDEALTNAADQERTA